MTGKIGFGVRLQSSNPEPLMSALGQKRTSQHLSDVRFVPIADSRCKRSSLIKTDDFHPVRAFSGRILADQLHGATCLVYRVG